MSLEGRLADELILKHPERAAVALERIGVEEAVRLLSHITASGAAPVLQRMSPQFASAVLGELGTEGIARVMEALPLDAAARLMRRLPPERATDALESIGEKQERALRSLLHFPEGTAGALMDPNVLALPEHLTAREAMERVREAPEIARYNVYIVDHQQRLVGVVNLRELLLARPRARLADLMVREPQRLNAGADRSEVVSHRGWREVHSLPVVDAQGAYLGAVRYRTLRDIEDQLLGGAREDANAGEALGRLFSAGAAGLFDSLSTTRALRTRGR